MTVQELIELENPTQEQANRADFLYGNICTWMREASWSLSVEAVRHEMENCLALLSCDCDDRARLRDEFGIDLDPAD